MMLTVKAQELNSNHASNIYMDVITMLQQPSRHAKHGYVISLNKDLLLKQYAS